MQLKHEKHIVFLPENLIFYLKGDYNFQKSDYSRKKTSDNPMSFLIVV